MIPGIICTAEHEWGLMAGEVGTTCEKPSSW